MCPFPEKTFRIPRAIIATGHRLRLMLFDTVNRDCEPGVAAGLSGHAVLPAQTRLVIFLLG